ncbi:hypothetical protein QTP70_024254, partial [Hemibagrus guttatus]
MASIYYFEFIRLLQLCQDVEEKHIEVPHDLSDVSGISEFLQKLRLGEEEMDVDVGVDVEQMHVDEVVEQMDVDVEKMDVMDMMEEVANQSITWQQYNAYNHTDTGHEIQLMFTPNVK